MVLEHAVLEVRAGEKEPFEVAFERARTIIASAAGFVGLRLSRCIESPNRYLLLVEWESLEHHTEGFRGSRDYEEWRRLLHHYYDPFPVVDHYVPVSQI